MRPIRPHFEIAAPIPNAPISSQTVLPENAEKDAEKAAEKDNPYDEWIGADIRCVDEPDEPEEGQTEWAAG